MTRTGFVVMACAFTIGCGPSGPPPLARATIGGSGGTIATATGDVEVVVPAGAFTGTRDLTITRATVSGGLATHALTPALRINGLPTAFTMPLAVRFKLAATPPTDAQLVVGLPGLAQHTLTAADAIHFVPTTIEGTTIVGSIPAPQAEASSGRADDATSESASVLALGISGWFTRTSTGGHFAVHFAELPQEPRAQALAAALETAHARFAELGFSYARRTNWPVSVTMDDIAGSERDGEHIPSLWGLNSHTLFFSNARLADPDVLRTTTGHEFFHLVQYFYDPRGAYARAKFAGDQAWLNEAAGAWSEELFTGLPGYIPEVHVNNEREGFKGYAQAASSPINYGYGMAPLVAHIVDFHGPEVLVTIYQHIFAGKHPLTAIELALGELLSLIWTEYLDAFVASEVYDLRPTEVNSLVERKVFTPDSERAEKVFSVTLPNFATTAFRVELDRAGSLAATTAFEANVDDPDAHLSVWEGRGGTDPLVMRGSAFGTVRVADVPALANAGKYLLLVLTRARRVPPYTDSRAVAVALRTTRDQTIAPTGPVKFCLDLQHGSTLPDSYEVTCDCDDCPLPAIGGTCECMRESNLAYSKTRGSVSATRVSNEEWRVTITSQSAAFAPQLSGGATEARAWATQFSSVYVPLPVDLAGPARLITIECEGQGEVAHLGGQEFFSNLSVQAPNVVADCNVAGADRNPPGWTVNATYSTTGYNESALTLIRTTAGARSSTTSSTYQVATDASVTVRVRSVPASGGTNP